MQIVISISESLYDRLIHMNSDRDTCSFNESVLVESIQNGTPLDEYLRSMKRANFITTCQQNMIRHEEV